MIEAVAIEPLGSDSTGRVRNRVFRVSDQSIYASVVTRPGNKSDRCGAGTRKEDAVTIAPEPHERDMPNLPGKQPTNAGADDREIDQILADSFPASDAPPWTLGVAQVPPENSGTKKKNRGNR